LFEVVELYEMGPRGKTASFLDYRTKSLGDRYCVMKTRVCRQRIGFFWPGVLAIVLVVSETATSPQAGVYAPFSFAQTELLVLVFRNSFFSKMRYLLLTF
jgi:hypothetical protein